MKRLARGARGQQGASLVVVLAFMVFVSAIVPAILGLSFTGLRVAGAGAQQRDLLYAAGSGIEIAVAAAQHDVSDGATGADCVEHSLEMDAGSVEVECRAYPAIAHRCGKGARVVAYFSDARGPSGSAGVAAQVVYQVIDGAQRATVTNWVSSAAGLSEPDESVCDWPTTTSVATTTTTTPPTTTSTTTTTTPATTSTSTTTTSSTTTSTSTTTTSPAPRATLTSRWASVRTVDKKKKWFVEGTVIVNDADGGDLRHVRVAVTEAHRDPQGRWVDHRTFTKRVNADGEVRIRSPRHRHHGTDAATDIRMTIVGVEDPGGRIWDPVAFPAGVSLRAP